MIVVNIYSTLTIFYQVSPHFREIFSIYVAVLVQNTCMYYYSLVLYSCKVNNSSISKYQGS